MRLALALTLVLFLGGCLSPLTFMNSLSGGGKGTGTSVNANTQVGKENNQSAIDQSRDISGENVEVNQLEGTFSLDGDAGNVKVLNQDIPMWIILVAILGWMLPSPIEIWRGFLKAITLGRYRG